MKERRHDAPRSIPAFLGYLLGRIVTTRRWLLLPLWLVLAVIALLIMLGGGPNLLPVIYLAF